MQIISFYTSKSLLSLYSNIGGFDFLTPILIILLTPTCFTRKSP
jgi:hypothetical protein